VTNFGNDYDFGGGYSITLDWETRLGVIHDRGGHGLDF